MFENDGLGNWTEVQKLSAAEPGNNDRFGLGVNIDGPNIIIGAEYDDAQGEDAGAAYYFREDTCTGNYTQVAKLLSDDLGAGDNMGRNVSSFGSIAIAGAHSTGGGKAFLFDLPGAAVPVDYDWSAGAGNWDTCENWSPEGKPGDGRSTTSTQETVSFGSTISSTSTVFTDKQVTINSVRFDNDSSYIIAGGGGVNMIASTGGVLPTLSVASGNHQFQAAVKLLDNTTVDVSSGSMLEFNNRLSLNNNTLTKTGDGAIAVNNILSSGGGTINLQQGTLAGGGTVGGDVVNDGGTVSPSGSLQANSIVPEPATWVMLGHGLLGAMALLRSRQY